MDVRRRTLSTFLVVVLMLTAGCLGLVTGSQPIQATATEPTVSDPVLESAGYEQAGTETRHENQTFSVAGQTREANVTSHFAEYQKTVDLGPIGEFRAAVFTVLATPQVNVLGQARNSVGDMSSVELVHLLQAEKYEELSVGRTVGTANETMLGKETTVTKLNGTADVGGVGIDVYLHVARVRHDGDFVVAFAAYPRSSSSEEAVVMTLLRGVEH